MKAEIQEAFEAMKAATRALDIAHGVACRENPVAAMVIAPLLRQSRESSGRLSELAGLIETEEPSAIPESPAQLG